MRKIELISISAADHKRLERLVRDRNTPQARIVFAGQRRADGGGDCGGGGQEPAHGPPLAPPLCGEGGRRPVEGRTPSVARQAVDAREEYLENHNANPKPFVWTKSASQILEKVVRAKQVLESQHYRNPSSASRKTERRIIVVVGHITLIVTLHSSELS